MISQKIILTFCLSVMIVSCHTAKLPVVLIKHTIEHENNIFLDNDPAFVDGGLTLGLGPASVSFISISYLDNDFAIIRGVVRYDETGEVLPGISVRGGDLFNCANDSCQYYVFSSATTNSKGEFQLLLRLSKDSFVAAEHIGFYGYIYRVGMLRVKK